MCLKHPNLYFQLYPIICACVHACEVNSVMSDSLRSHGLQPTRLLCPWNSPGKNPRVGCHALLQGDLPNPGIQPASLTSPALAEGFFITSPLLVHIQSTLSLQLEIQLLVLSFVKSNLWQVSNQSFSFLKCKVRINNSTSWLLEYSIYFLFSPTSNNFSVSSFRFILFYSVTKCYKFLRLNPSPFLSSCSLMFKYSHLRLQFVVQSLSRVQLFCDPMYYIARQAPLSMGLPRQEYWSGLPFPSPEDLPDPGIEPTPPEYRQILYHQSHQRSCLQLTTIYMTHKHVSLAQTSSINSRIQWPKKKKKRPEVDSG